MLLGVTIYFYKHDLLKFELSKKYIDKAIELKPDNATVRIARGTYYYRGFRDYGKDFSFAKKLEPEIVLPILYRFDL